MQGSPCMIVRDSSPAGVHYDFISGERDTPSADAVDNRRLPLKSTIPNGAAAAGTQRPAGAGDASPTVRRRPGGGLPRGCCWRGGGVGRGRLRLE